jgi:hypothetical protein
LTGSGWSETIAGR